MKIKNIILIFLVALLLVMPFGVKAEGETDNRVIVNFFHGDGCGYCAAAQKFFDSIRVEYGSKYKLVKYEVWSNEKNQALMSAVAEYLNADAGGVPFIIIGDKVFNGYTASYDSQIISKIEDEYEKPQAERINITDKVNLVGEADEVDNSIIEEKDDGIVTAIIFIVAIVAFAGIIVLARQKSNAVSTNKIKKETRKDSEKVEPVKKEEEKKEVKINKQVAKTKQTKKKK